jgi:hypothetical protein
VLIRPRNFRIPPVRKFKKAFFLLQIPSRKDIYYVCLKCTKVYIYRLEFALQRDPDWGSSLCFCPASLPFSGYRRCFPGVKQPEHEISHSSPSRAEVKKECSSTSAPPICLRGLDRKTFTFYLIVLVTWPLQAVVRLSCVFELNLVIEWTLQFLSMIIFGRFRKNAKNDY